MTQPSVSDLVPAYRAGFYLSIVVAGLTLVTFAIAILTPPLSGPLCAADCYQYPFADVAPRFPRDYYWMFPAMLLSVLYIAWNAAIHQSAALPKKTFSLIGLCLAVLGGGTLLVDYFLQVSVIQPSLLQGETDGIALLSQYNPHGIFIALEELGFLLMSASLFAMAPVFSGANGVERALRWLAIGGFLSAVAALAAFSATYGVGREYRFELAVISIVWISLIVAGVLTAVFFRRLLRS